MKVLILVGLAFLSIIQLHDAVELNSEAIEDGQHGANRLKREVTVTHENSWEDSNCNGDGSCNNERKKRHSNTGNGYGNGMNSNCQGPNCNGYRDNRHENRNGRPRDGQVNVGNDNHNGLNVNCNGMANCNSGNSHGDHRVDVGNGNYGTAQYNCNGVGKCNSGSAPTRNCDYRNNQIYENGTSRAMTYEEINELHKYRRQINAYINQINQIVNQYNRDLVEKSFTEHVTMAPFPAVPNPPCFCQNC